MEKEKSAPVSDSYTTSRFHLHPSVQVERDLDTNQVLVTVFVMKTDRQ